MGINRDLNSQLWSDPEGLIVFALLKMHSLIKKKVKEVAGWKELVSFPEWGIKNVVAKLDTGAKGSALDVKNIKELPGNQISFEIVLHRENRDFTRKVIADVESKARVKSSTGHVQERYKVCTKVKIGEKILKTIHISLVCRKSMFCRMLLGRTALEDTFLIDSGQKFALEKFKRTKKIKQKS